MDVLIDHEWRAGGGGEFASIDPATGDTVWRGRAASRTQIDEAIAAARRAAPHWSETPLEGRIAYLRTFAQRVNEQAPALAELISRETGKPLWESLEEVRLVASKVDLSIRAYGERRRVSMQERDGMVSAMRFKPHGVMAVFGPFNMPAHLPSGHIIPALLSGNTVVFKPSEQTPAVGRRLAELWLEANLPAGVINLVQGGREVGAMLAQHAGLDGLLFTGSVGGGKAIMYACADQPQKLLALEMGGNNPLVIWNTANKDAAAYLASISAYLTSGQRCSCARRLILRDGPEASAVIDRLVPMIARLRVGTWRDRPEPFMGPLINANAARHMLEAQDQLRRRGGRVIVEMRPMNDTGTMLSPGLVDVTAVRDRRDEELFGPLLQVIRVRDFDAAIAEANSTSFGLVAALICDDPKLYQRFFARVRAGLINWNRQSTGASGALPFGGVGESGNHRPAGFWSVDYCSYPIASLETDRLTMPDTLMPGIEP